MYVEVGSWSDRQRPSGCVVAGFNGKDHCRPALVWAAREAERRGVPLLVLYAANYSGMTLEPGPGLLERDPMALEAAEEVTAQGVAEALDAVPGLTVYGATEVTGPTRALVEACEDAALVAVGSRGLGRVLGALLGSVAFTVAARATGPVVIVKGETPPASVPGASVVAGTDGSSEAEAALDFAAAQAADTAAPLLVMAGTGGPRPGIHEEEQLDYAKRIVSAAALRAVDRHPGLPVTTRVEHAPADETLVDASREAAMVVVGTRGRGSFEGALLGSVSHAVIHAAHSPVAVV